MTIQSWSSSGLLGYLTAIERSRHVNGPRGQDLRRRGRTLAKIPLSIVIGDHAPNPGGRSGKFNKEIATTGGNVAVTVLPEAGIFRHGHDEELEKNNKHIMHRMIAWPKRTPCSSRNRRSARLQ